MAPATAASPPAALRSVTLASAVDFDGFRRACRQLWAEQVAPEHVSWHSADDVEGDLFEADSQGATGATASPGAVPPVNAPAAFLPLSESVVLHSDPGRFGLLYRLLWRLQVAPGLRADPLDPDWLRANELAQAVRRDMHKMKAFVRFRTIAEPGEDDAEPLHVAWFEPEHHIVEATAPFFSRRFTAMRWAILTPERSVRWDGNRLFLGPGARRDQAPPADAGEKLWLTYYESIFNPARLKLQAMQKEMPKRYWKNLPEAQLIDPLAAVASERSLTMIARGPTEPRRRPTTEPRPTLGRAESPGGDSPASLPSLREALDRCRECPIGEHATQAVPGEGLVQARLMFVGEQPGDQEDLQGRPFVGPAGMLLARALEELGVPRSKVYITNAVKHFKFELRGKRRIHKTPAQQEAAACLHWLESEIELVDPGALVALGATAARQLMGTAVAVTRERGRWLRRSDGRRVLITLHPSALLRMEPGDKEAAYAAWLADLRLAAAHFGSSDDRAG
ncbi:MAG: UdgX family uracil-DNA binding protein [Caldimonas sp.]